MRSAWARAEESAKGETLEVPPLRELTENRWQAVAPLALGYLALLEPSFGACGFLEAAADRLREAGAASPLDQLYGCDIDEEAFTKYLDPKLGRGVEAGRYLHRDLAYCAEETASLRAGR